MTRPAPRAPLDELRVSGFPLLMIATILIILSNRGVPPGEGALGTAYGALGIALPIAIVATFLPYTAFVASMAARRPGSGTSPFGGRCLRWSLVAIRMLVVMAAARALLVVGILLAAGGS